MVLENSASWEPGNDMSEHSELMPEIARGVPLIKVMGIGGGGSNAVSRMYKDKLPVVEYYAVNTDAQHLFRCDVGHRMAIGQNLTRGLGSGALPRRTIRKRDHGIEERGVIFPVGHDQMTVRRLPWVTFGFMAACVVVMALLNLSISVDLFGLVPQSPSFAGFFGHSFIHAGWGHMAGNLFLLFMAGPPIEDRWGRPLFAAFFVSCGLFAGAFFMTTAPDSPLPLG